VTVYIITLGSFQMNAARSCGPVHVHACKGVGLFALRSASVLMGDDT
jgi:hypothetical protein